MVVLDENVRNDWLLGEWMTARVLNAYLKIFGTLNPLRRKFGIALPQGPLPGSLQGLSVYDLHHLCGSAVQQLSAEENRAAGRTPLRPVDWRVILFSLSGARTVREAIHRCIDCFEAIDWRCGRMSLRTRDREAELDLDAMRGSESMAGCLIDLSGIAEIHALLEWLIARPLPLTRICLNYDPEMFEGLGTPPLPYPLKLAAGWTGFTFASTFLDYPVERITDDILERPRHSFLFEAEDRRSSEDAADQVRRIAMRALRADQRLPSFEEVAAAAGTSPATLRRRLMRQKTSYRQIKESCRRELGLRMLRHSSLSIEDIAAQLDYCDSDAFRRAFRSWMGMSPSKLRAETLARYVPSTARTSRR